MRVLRYVSVVLSILFSSQLAFALMLPSVFSDHMVLQREMPVNVWGRATAGEKVTVRIANQNVSAVTSDEGYWQLALPAMKATTDPITMRVEGASDTITITNVLVGEVWVCSGQSNMERPLKRTSHAQEAATNAPTIRHFKVPHVTAVSPVDDVQASWVVATPASTMDFSAVGYHFALIISEELGVPVGLVNNSWGGSRIEPYVSLKGMQGQQGLSDKAKQEIADLENILMNARELDAQYIATVKQWIEDAEAAHATGDNLSGIPQHPGEKPSVQSLAMKYNAMVHPVIPYTIRGVLWYQGESNMGESDYAVKQKALIEDWRQRWGLGRFPFYYVQLAPFARYSGEKLGRFWEQQQQILSLVENTGMAVITDISTLKNIHPPNKKDVGYRLAQLALHHDYERKDVEYSGPVFREMKVADGKALLSFDHAEGLTSDDEAGPKWFEVAGNDKVFHSAAATIQDGKVVVQSPEVVTPVAVRMGWEKNAEPNLRNHAELVASPFRTDDW